MALRHFLEPSETIPPGTDAKDAHWLLVIDPHEARIFRSEIQQPALEIWQGQAAHVLAAQQALYHRAKCNRAARRGEYNTAMEVGTPSKDEFRFAHALGASAKCTMDTEHSCKLH